MNEHELLQAFLIAFSMVILVINIALVTRILGVVNETNKIVKEINSKL